MIEEIIAGECALVLLILIRACGGFWLGFGLDPNTHAEGPIVGEPDEMVWGDGCFDDQGVHHWYPLARGGVSERGWLAASGLAIHQALDQSRQLGV
ncbi:hypothetical protein CCR91_06150 [Thiorhodovibrio winogradskyi]|nr:hypothetical protein [Thiorhodovibrio winogradskyi]